MSLLLASSLAAGLLNVTSSVLLRPEGLARIPPLLACAAASVAIVLGLQSAILAAALKLFRRCDTIACAAAAGLSFIAAGALWPLQALAAEQPQPRALALRAALLLPALLAAPLGYLAAGRLRHHRRARHLGLALLPAVPLLAAETLLLVWWQLFEATGVVSTESVAGIAGYLLAAALTLAACAWLGAGNRVLPTLATMVLVTLLCPWPALVTGGRAAERAVAAGDRPRCILLLTADTLRADTLAGAGTPALDALAGDSIVFSNARSAGPWTKPGFASMMTGLSPLVHGADTTRARLPDELTTLAEYLREAGYATAAIGNNTFLRQEFNFDQGFDHYSMFPSSLGRSWGAKLLAVLWPQRFPPGDPSTRELTVLALDWLRRHRDQPFFLWLHYFDPHMPYAPPAEFLPPAPAAPRIGQAFAEFKLIRGGLLVPDTAERQWIRQLYEAEVRYVDANAGRLLDEMRRLELYEPCLIVFTSDHGEELWEHGSFEHGHTLFDEVLRVPLSIKLPFATAGSTVAAAVSTESVTPSVLDVAGVRSGADAFTSDSLAGYWRQPDAAQQPASPTLSTGVMYYDPQIAVVFDGLKYLKNLVTGREEIYDLAGDPRESAPVTTCGEQGLRQARSLLAARRADAEQRRRALDLPEGDGVTPEGEVLERLRALGYL